MNRLFLAAVLLFSLAAGIYAEPLIDNMETYSGNQSNAVFEPPSDTEGRESSLHCKEDSQCRKVSLNETVEECNDWYYTRPVSDLECNMTKEHVEEVTMVTDPANHLRTEFTDEGFTVDYLDLVKAETRGHQDLEFLPDGKIMMVRDYTTLSVYTQNGEPVRNASIGKYIDGMPEKNSVGQIKGFAVDPGYEENGHIYVYYLVQMGDVPTGYSASTKRENFRRVVSRFSFDPQNESGVLEEEERFIDYKGAKWHSGGSVEFSPHGKLFVTMGEGGEGSRAQNISNYGGKILRMNRDGSVPEDNPFDGSYVFTYGHRNPQGIGWSPRNGQIYAAEHGNKRHDEINRLEKGKNYGWPEKKCGEDRTVAPTFRNSDYSDPVRCYKNWTMAPSRLTFVDNTSSPWYGDMFLAGLRGKHLRHFEFSENDIEDESIFFYSKKPSENDLSREFRDVEYFNGSLWVLGEDSGVARLKPSEE